jgi:hypothetical protein
MKLALNQVPARKPDANAKSGRPFSRCHVIEVDRKMLDVNGHEAAEPLRRHPRMSEWLDSELATHGNGQPHS